MRNPALENWLKTQKFDWTYAERVKVSDILVDDAARLNIRLTEKLDDGFVYRYAQDFKDKVDLFAVVLYPVGGGRYGVLDGGHRAAGAELADVAELDAYVFDVSDERIISMLRRVLNTITNGKGLSIAECVEHACALVNEGHSAAAAARAMGIKPSAITDRIRVEAILRDIASVGGDVVEAQKLPVTTIRMIGMVPRAVDKSRIASLAARATLNSKDVQRFVDEFVGALSTEKAEDVFRKYEARLAEYLAEVALKKGRHHGRSSPRWMVLSRKMRECDAVARQIGKNISKKDARESAKEVQAHIQNITAFLHGLRAVIEKR